MRYWFTRRNPPPTRFLVIESGSRALLEKLLPHFYDAWKVPVDIVTCFGGLPEGLRPDARVYRVNDLPGPEARKQFIRDLRAANYTMAAMVCSGEPIMSKWKVLLFLRVPARFLIINENGDYFPVHRDNAANIRAFALDRLGMTGAGAIRTLLRLLFFPFSIVYLLLWAFTVHARRALRLAFARQTNQP